MAISKALITGVGGFLGSSLAKELKASGVTVTGIARNDYQLLRAAGINLVRADIGALDSSDYRHFEDVDVVFHVAAKVGMWGKWDEFYRTNVIGTQNIIAACRHVGVPALVYTSSPSVIADGTNLRGVNESYPYPKHYDAFYPHTKAIAEQAVLSAHSASLATLSLRPHLIWGPGDTNLIPTILRKARAGRLVRVGAGQNRVDLSYIADCVQAHLKAADSLIARPKLVGGRTFFISQGEPVNLWDWIGEVLVRSGFAPIKRSIPRVVAETVGVVAETICKLLPSYPEPFITKFLASEMATDHYFDISSARELLGYQPQVAIAEGLNLTFGTHERATWQPEERKVANMSGH